MEVNHRKFDEIPTRVPGNYNYSDWLVHKDA